MFPLYSVKERFPEYDIHIILEEDIYDFPPAIELDTNHGFKLPVMFYPFLGEEK